MHKEPSILDGTLARVRAFAPGPVGTVEDFGRKAKAWASKQADPVSKAWDDLTDSTVDWFEEKTDIPRSLKSGDVAKIQHKVDSLTKKAKRGRSFTKNEKSFLTDLYGWVATGGRWKWVTSFDPRDYDKGLWEAGELLEHYLDGKGKPLEIDSDIYESSTVAKYAVGEIKSVIENDLRKGDSIRNGGAIRSTEVLARKNWNDPAKKGQILRGGVLLAEQDNKRLKYANNRFVLKSKSVVTDRDNSGDKPVITVRTVWRVDDRWDYASFAEQRKNRTYHVTKLPLANGRELRLPDGLSHYMTTQGIATEFDYYSEWTETWSF